MKNYWFKKYGKNGQIPINWKGWAFFTFIIGLFVQVSNHINNILYVFIGVVAVGLFGYSFMRWKTNPNETYSKDTDSIWKTQVWGGFVGILGLFVVFISFAFFQSIKNEQITQDTINPKVSEEIQVDIQPREQTNTIDEDEIGSESSIVSTPSVTEKSEQSYVNQQYGFSLMPPANWIADESGEADTVVFFLNKITDNEDGYSWQGSINVGVFDGNAGFSIDDIVANYKLQIQEWVKDFTVIEEKKIKIGRYDAIIVSGTFIREGHKFRDYRLFILKEDNLYNVSGVVLNSTWDKYKKVIIDTVLSFSF